MATQFAFGKVVTDGLVLALDASDRNSYPGSGTTWRDLSGANNNGIFQNGPTFNSSNGGSVVLDGTDDIVVVNDASNLDFGTSEFSVGIWFYVSSSVFSSNTEYGIIDKNPLYEGNAGWGFEISSWGHTSPFNTVSVQLYNTGQSAWGNSNTTTTINTNRWNSIFGTRSGNTFVLYKNGTLASQKTNADIGISVNNSSNLILGDHSWGPSLRSNIANVQVYNRTLSAAEVQQNYNAQKSRFGLS